MAHVYIPVLKRQEQVDLREFQFSQSFIVRLSLNKFYCMQIVLGTMRWTRAVCHWELCSVSSSVWLSISLYSSLTPLVVVNCISEFLFCFMETALLCGSVPLNLQFLYLGLLSAAGITGNCHTWLGFCLFAYFSIMSLFLSLCHLSLFKRVPRSF